MCTVTFIRVKDSFFLTSNRDEKWVRSQALPPKVYLRNDVTLLFPKDADAGGTWIALRDNSTVAILLNGAFRKHQIQPTYRLSRGLVLIDILSAPVPDIHFSQMNLEGIEPFTLILFQNFVLFECRWDGYEKFKKQLSNKQNHIWSSATLYDEMVQRKRADWFVKWLNGNSRPSKVDIFHFHQFAGDGDEQNALRMNRNGQLFTVSITGIELTREAGTMNYLDLKDGATYAQKQCHTTSHVL